MDIDTVIEIVYKGLIICEYGGEAEFELGIIGGDKNFARWRNETLADAFALLGADRDVLEIRIARREPTCRPGPRLWIRWTACGITP